MRQEEAVFSINFLRRESGSPLLRLLLNYLAGIYLVASLLALGALTAGTFAVRWMNDQSAASLSSDEGQQGIEGLKKELTLLRGEVASHLAVLEPASKAHSERFQVTGKLSALARTLPPRTWIKEIEGSRADRTLKVKAVYLVDPEHPYDGPDKPWMQALRSDAEFGAGLKKFEILKSLQKKQGNTELYSFELSAEWGAQ